MKTISGILKRGRGERNRVGETRMTALRLIHGSKNGIEEPELRKKLEESLHIGYKSNILNQLQKLKSEQLIICMEKDKSCELNIWKSNIYNHVNSELKKCDGKELSESELKLADFLVEYSYYFLFIISKDLCKSYHKAKQMIKIRSIYNACELFRKKMMIVPSTPTIDKPNLLSMSSSFLSVDLIWGDINKDDSKFWDDYRKILLFFYDKETVDKMIYDAKTAIDLVKPTDEELRNFEKIFKF